MGNYTWDGYCFQKNKSNPKYTYTIFYNPVHIFLATPMFSQNSQPSMTFHDHPNIFWIAHAGLAQLPDRHQKEPQCFQESRRTRCQWPMSWLHVHKKKSIYLRTQVSGLQHCLDMFGLHHNKVGTVNRNL